jgi:hypothetical protein
MLDDEVLGTSRAILKGTGLDEDLFAAIEAGRLRFVPAGPGDVKRAAMLNEIGLPKVVAAMAAQAKERHAAGLLGDQAYRATAMSYLRAAYDTDAVADTRALKAMQMIDDARKEAKKLPPKEAAELVARASRKAMKLYPGRNSDGGVVSAIRDFNAFHAFHAADAKYHLSLEEQFKAGRRGSDALREVLQETMIDNARVLGEHKLFTWTAEHLSKAEADLPDGALAEIRSTGRAMLGRDKVLTLYDGTDRWVKVPETTWGPESLVNGKEIPKFGPLAGRWVREPDFRRIEDFRHQQSEFWQKTMGAWKANKVIGNIPSHWGQWFEVGFKALMAGLFGLPGALRDLHAYTKGGGPEWVRSFVRSGAFEGNLLVAGLDMTNNNNPMKVARRAIVEAQIAARATVSESPSKVLREIAANGLLTGARLYHAMTQAMINPPVKKWPSFLNAQRVWTASDAAMRGHVFKAKLERLAKDAAIDSGRPWREHFDELARDEAAVQAAALELGLHMLASDTRGSQPAV